MAAPDFRSGAAVWRPAIGALCRRESDGAFGVWDGAAFVLVTDLGGGGGGGVSSVFGRTGDVVAAPGDYAGVYAPAAQGVPTGGVVYWPDALGPVPAGWTMKADSPPLRLGGGNVPGVWIGPE